MNEWAFKTLRWPDKLPPPVMKRAAGKMGLSKNVSRQPSVMSWLSPALPCSAT